jgi:endonuclease III
MLSSRNSRKLLKKKQPVKKLWKAAPSKLLAKATNKARPKTGPGPGPADVKTVLDLLQKNYPGAHCALLHRNEFELLVATILSAQCTDERVNKVTPDLFARFPTPQAMAEAPLEEIEYLIRSANFFKNKAKNLKACAAALVSRYQGQVPRTMDDLTSLAGVGRKTANVVLGNAFNIPVGIVVDTHVARLSYRLGWTRHEDPLKIEADLQKIIPEDMWIMIAHLVIFHGRQICKARQPLCETCFLFDHCPKKGVKLNPC